MDVSLMWSVSYGDGPFHLESTLESSIRHSPFPFLTKMTSCSCLYIRYLVSYYVLLTTFDVRCPIERNGISQAVAVTSDVRHANVIRSARSVDGERSSEGRR